MVGPSEDSALTPGAGTVSDANGTSGVTFAAYWLQADAPETGTPADDAYSEISGSRGTVTGAMAAVFTPLQAQVGKFLRLCYSFTDEDGYDEVACWTSVAAVVNVDDAPVATDNTIDIPLGTTEYSFAFDDFTYRDEDGADTPGHFIRPWNPCPQPVGWLHIIWKAIVPGAGTTLLS